MSRSARHVFLFLSASGASLVALACSVVIPYGDYDSESADAGDAQTTRDATTPPPPEAGPAVDAGPPTDAFDAMSAYDGPAYATVIENDSPLVYLRLDDVSGPAVTNQGSHMVSGATYGADVQFRVPGALAHDNNTAVSVPGTSSAVDLTADDAFRFQGNAPYTLEVWCKPDGATVKNDEQQYHAFWSRNQPTDGAVQRVAYAAGILGPHVFSDRLVDGDLTDGNLFYTTTQTELVPAVWIYVAVTYDGSNQVLYYDGVAQKSGVYDAGLDFADAEDLLIGGQKADLTTDMATFFVGSLDELAIYDHALTADRILLHYVVGSGMSPPVQGDP